MKKWAKNVAAIGLGASALFASVGALANTPLCSCYDSGGGKIMSEGGVTDGSAAVDVTYKLGCQVISAFKLHFLPYVFKEEDRQALTVKVTLKIQDINFYAQLFDVVEGWVAPYRESAAFPFAIYG